MFGLIAARPVGVGELLHDAPRSLRSLAREHCDGWGVALRMHEQWAVHRATACAASCAQFGELARGLETTLVVAHVRKKTVGELALRNTHPFQRGRFVFAHNGTVTDVAALVARTSPERLAEIRGDTDSERLFAFVLAHVDAAGDVERGVRAAVLALHGLGTIGSASFLLSCGSRLYAHRLGRTLFTAQRGDFAMVASEPTTDELWQELPERDLVILDPPTTARALAA